MQSGIEWLNSMENHSYNPISVSKSNFLGIERFDKSFELASICSTVMDNLTEVRFQSFFWGVKNITLLFLKGILRVIE